MGNDYMQNPPTVKALAQELKIACDDYFTKKINNERIQEVITWYATAQADKLFVGKELNSTVAKIIGKRRVRLVTALLPN